MTTRHTAGLLLTLLLVLSYCYVLPRWADWNQNSRLDLVRALSEERTVIIDRYWENTGDYALFNGHKYSDKAPGPAFLALPAALALQPLIAMPVVEQRLQRAAGGQAFETTLNPNGTGLRGDKVSAFLILFVVTTFSVTVPSALACVALFMLLRRLGFASQQVLVVTLGYGLATTVAIYAGNFYSHALVASLLVSAWFFGVLPWHPRRAVLIGLLLGWAVISEYPAALPAAVIGVAVALRWRKWAVLPWMVLGGLPTIVLLAWYDWAAFGTLLPTGYAHSALWQQQHQTGFVSLTYPHPEALLGLLFGQFRGLFVRSPWLLLSLPGVIIWWRSGRERIFWWVVVLSPISLVLVYGSSAMWWGGYAAGPRYIVGAIPFLAIASTPAITLLWRHIITRIAILGLLLVSAALTWMEGLAGQSFPPDTIYNPWLEYTLPAWSNGNIARNVGNALGLHGAASLLPLVLAVIVVIALIWRTTGSQALEQKRITAEGAHIAPLQN